MSVNHSEISSFIWNFCDDVLRGLFKPHEYGDIILPFTEEAILLAFNTEPTGYEKTALSD